MSREKQAFLAFADATCSDGARGETVLCTLSGERSDFVRCNRARVRQAGSVEQRYLTLRLIADGRQASASFAAAGDEADLATARRLLGRLRETLAQLPQDPWLLIAEQPSSTTSERRGTLASADAVLEQVTRSDADLAGFYAGGVIYRGFANSLGQRNWHEVDTFNLEWSLYLRADKAVKDTYAGFDWDSALFAAKLAASRERLELLAQPARTLEPGEYRAYLAPHAVAEVMALLGWDGFSARARATRQTPLLRLEHGASLSPKVSISENSEGGVAPRFQQDGFVKPDRVDLIRAGALAQTLVSPRSAKEYRLPMNGANAREMPESIDIAPGALPAVQALAALDTGIYVGNLWYLNFSDRPAGRITGMTRFATFWVEHGRVVGPVNAMRFDDIIYRMLGENLADLTDAAELMLDPSTYDERSTGSTRVPGALLSALRFTL